MKVERFHSNNQFVIYDVGYYNKSINENETVFGSMFQSYNFNIAFIGNDGQVYLDKRFWDYSRTTGKYRNLFLSETKKETEKKITSGEYILINLNIGG